MVSFCRREIWKNIWNDFVFIILAFELYDIAIKYKVVELKYV